MYLFETLNIMTVVGILKKNYMQIYYKEQMHLYIISNLIEIKFKEENKILLTLRQCKNINIIGYNETIFLFLLLSLQKLKQENLFLNNEYFYIINDLYLK